MVRNEVWSRTKFAKETGVRYFEMMVNSHKTGYNVMASVYLDKLAQARRILLHYNKEFINSIGKNNEIQLLEKDRIC